MPSERNTEDFGGHVKFLLVGLYVAWFVLISASAFQDFVFGLEGPRIWLLDLDGERGLYTWVSQLWLAAISLVLFDIAANCRASTKVVKVYWFVLSAAFLYLSMDEALSLHEKLERIVPADAAEGFLYFRWVIPGLLTCIVFAVTMVPFIRHLPKSVAVMSVVSGAIFVGGAIGMEMVGGQIAYLNVGDTFVKLRIEVTIEECMEGLGALLFLTTLVTNRARLIREGSVVAPKGAAAPARVALEDVAA